MVKIDRIDVTTYSIHIQYHYIHKDEQSNYRYMVIQDWQKDDKLIGVFQGLFQTLVEGHLLRKDSLPMFDWELFLTEFKTYEDIMNGGKK